MWRRPSPDRTMTPCGWNGARAWRVNPCPWKGRVDGKRTDHRCGYSTIVKNHGKKCCTHPILLLHLLGQNQRRSTCLSSYMTYRLKNLSMVLFCSYFKGARGFFQAPCRSVDFGHCRPRLSQLPCSRQLI